MQHVKLSWIQMILVVKSIAFCVNEMYPVYNCENLSNVIKPPNMTEKFQAESKQAWYFTQ